MVRRLAELKTSFVQAGCAATGVQTISSDCVHPSRWNVLRPKLQELVHWQLPLGMSRGFAVATIEIAKRHLPIADRKQTMIANGAAAEVLGKVDRNSCSVIVALEQPDVPSRASQSIEQRQASRLSRLAGQRARRLLDKCSQSGQQLATKHVHQNAWRQQAVLLGRLPRTVLGQSATGDDEVYMWMSCQGLAPSMQGPKQTGSRPHELRIGQQSHQRFFGGAEEFVCEPPLVHSPQRHKFLRDSENHMMRRRVKHLGLPSRQPSCSRSARATRTNAMAARVVVDGFQVTMFAAFDMATQDRSATMSQQVGGSADKPWLRILVGERLPVLQQNRLQRQPPPSSTSFVTTLRAFCRHSGSKTKLGFKVMKYG